MSRSFADLQTMLPEDYEEWLHELGTSEAELVLATFIRDYLMAVRAMRDIARAEIDEIEQGADPSPALVEAMTRVSSRFALIITSARMLELGGGR